MKWENISSENCQCQWEAYYMHMKSQRYRFFKSKNGVKPIEVQRYFVVNKLLHEKGPQPSIFTVLANNLQLIVKAKKITMSVVWRNQFPIKLLAGVPS